MSTVERKRVGIPGLVEINRPIIPSEDQELSHPQTCASRDLSGYSLTMTTLITIDVTRK